MQLRFSTRRPENTCLIVLTVAIFALPIYFRYIFLGNLLGRINLLGIVTLLMVFKNHLRKSRNLLLFFVATLLTAMTQMNNGGSIKFTVLAICNLFVPLMLLATFKVEFWNKYSNIEIQLLLKKIIKVFNTAVVILFVWAAVDYVTHKAVGRVLIRLTHDASMISMANSSNTRFVSFYGHPLAATTIFLMFYIVNNLYYREVLKQKQPVFHFLISLVGILFCGSKAGLLLVIILFLVTSITKGKYLVAGIIVILAVYRIGLFDIVLARLGQTTLTTGRLESWAYLQRFNINYFPIVIGHGIYYVYSTLNNMYYNASAAFEFMPLMFCTDYGVLFTIIFYLIGFVSPIIYVWKNSGFISGVCVLIAAIQLNIYTGIGNYVDVMYMYVWFMLICQLIVYFSKRLVENEV